jgi:hypothetical protein
VCLPSPPPAHALVTCPLLMQEGGVCQRHQHGLFCQTNTQLGLRHSPESSTATMSTYTKAVVKSQQKWAPTLLPAVCVTQ